METIMKIATRFLSLMVIAMTTLGAHALSFDGSWTNQKIPLKSANQYTQNGGTLSVTSNAGVSILYRAVFQNVTTASWNWQVAQSVPATNLRGKGGDDRNLSLYFVFMPEAEAGAVQGQSLTKILRNPQAKALIYTYGGNEGRGASFQSPYTGGRGQVIIMAPAGAGSGQESVNLTKDFQSAYGEAAGTLIGIGVSSDSDDTGSTVEATISNLAIQ